MKYVFFAALTILLILSGVTRFMEPDVRDDRVVIIDFLMAHGDADGDGQVSPSDVGSVIAVFDQDGDGAVSQDELRAVVGDTKLPGTGPETDLMDLVDDDWNGSITASDLETLLRRMDGDGDGVLTQADYPSEPPVELIWASGDAPVRRETVRMFNKLNPGYHVTLDPNVGQMQKVIVQCLAGVGPDILDCWDSTALTFYVKAEVAYDLTDHYTEWGISQDDQWECLRSLCEIDGRIYGHGANAHAPAIWYNKDLFDEAGVPYPEPGWTWDDLIEKSQKLTKRTEEGRPVQVGFLGPWDRSLYGPLLFQFGADWYTPEGTRCVLDSEEAGAAFQFGQDLVYKYKIMLTPSDEEGMATAGGWGSGAITWFAGEKGAMAIGGRWWLMVLRRPEYAHLRLGVVPMPRAKYNRVDGGGKSTLVNRKSKHLEGALRFIRFMDGPEYNQLLNKWADGLAPVKKYCYTDEFLFDPEFPQEDYNKVWRDAVEMAEPIPTSPYANGNIVMQELEYRKDTVRFGMQSGREAMDAAAKKINDSIVEMLRLDPQLRERYYKEIEKGARPAWDNEEEAP